MRVFSFDRFYISRTKFPTDFTYRNLHGLVRAVSLRQHGSCRFTNSGQHRTCVKIWRRRTERLRRSGAEEKKRKRNQRPQHFRIDCVTSLGPKGAITSKIKHAIKHKTSFARLARLLQPSLVLDGTPSLAASWNKMLMRVSTVVQQLCQSCGTCFKFYCMFYFTCDRSLIVNKYLLNSLIYCRPSIYNVTFHVCDVRRCQSTCVCR